jgi:ferredoxin-NADP reductase
MCFQAAFAKTKGIIKAAQAGAFLCGHKEMAQDVTALLLADGMPKNRILLNF